MANYMCIRVVARPVNDKKGDFAKLCKVIKDSDEFVESIGGNPNRVWLDIDNYEPDYNDEELRFQLIAKYNYPRHELEEGLSDNYVVDYDIVFADEFETYEIDYLSNNPDILLSKVGCIGVYKKRRLSNAEPNDGFDYVEKYFFPQSEEEKHLMYTQIINSVNIPKNVIIKKHMQLLEPKKGSQKTRTTGGGTYYV